ncbi:MAG: hypothetical protein J6R48_00015, partial [Muribaculaceae bacterium]|nr:hypothetical protein [Muribaculaceae bacterium]
KVFKVTKVFKVKDRKLSVICTSVIDLMTLFFCYAQGPGPFADYRLGTVTPSLATYIFLAAKAMSSE